MERGQQRGQVDVVGGHCPDGDMPADQSGQLVDGEARAGHRGERGPRVGKYRRAHLGQPHRASRAIQQLLPELAFQAPDLRADAWLSHVHLRRRPGEVGLLRHCHETLELSKFHNQSF